EFIRDLAAKHAIQPGNIIIDSDGLGVGVADYVRGCTHFLNGSKPLQGENYENLKSQCYMALADAVLNKEIYVDCESDVRQRILSELEQIRRKDKDNLHKMGVESKKDLKKEN